MHLAPVLIGGQVIHSDLKVRNVLLKSDGSGGRGVIAKVADFGLAVRVENMDTHVSAFQVRLVGVGLNLRCLLAMAHTCPKCRFMQLGQGAAPSFRV